MTQALKALQKNLKGELHLDDATRILYATDASAYSEMPLAVAIPKDEADLKLLIHFARENQTSLIPRTAGTSLAGQVVGAGIVVDVSKYFNQILELNKEAGWVRVQPGVVRDELNAFLRQHELYFGPETSTANRAMIGGMVGNNSCGSNSVIYRSTREHTLELEVLLSDGSSATFGALEFQEFMDKCTGDKLENELYRSMRDILIDPLNQQEIRKEYPKKSVERRNTGYAIDLLLETEPFTSGGEAFNFCKLICGSEGTLAFVTEIKLNLIPLPTKESGMLCVHFNSIDDALRANIIALEFQPNACELIDHYVLERTKENKEQNKNRFFVQGDPEAILVIEYARENQDEVLKLTQEVEAAMRAAGLGYHFPVLFGADIPKIWSLRKAGLGLLGNMPGDDKPVPVIEDTSVDVLDLPAYIREFNLILKKYGLFAVHYAHAGSGELHLRPILNLKTEEGNALFRTIAQEIASLVKKYQGSLSGEHGDGRLRGEFIPQMIGAKNYALLERIKKTWDPEGIFNPHKIVDTPPMNTMLRYTPGQKSPNFDTIFRFYDQDILQHAEQCNGSGDCRKLPFSGGTMCPSYMATRNEKDTTRARANMLRHYLTNSNKMNRFDHAEIKEVMDLCISCKGCKSECPSNVDMAKLKAEFLQHYYDSNGVPFRARLISKFTQLNKLAAWSPGMYNGIMRSSLISKTIKRIIGFAPERSMPLLYKTTLRSWFKTHKKKRKGTSFKKKVYLFCDEFTNFNDTEIGIQAVLLLESLGYEVDLPKHEESGRAAMSKGLLRQAKQIAEQNVRKLKDLISSDTPLLGVEPSAILTFRDEYPDLVDDKLLEAAHTLASNSFMVDEFIAEEMKAGRISKAQFTSAPRKIKLHGHCQQKAWSAQQSSQEILAFPENYTVEVIPSGCCGMAGSFGYEKEHFDLSMQIGELVLFPAIRNSQTDTLIAAPGTSCRHQIKDGAHKKALHPIEILYQALAT